MILVYLFWNQPLFPRPEKRRPMLKIFPTFSLTGVIPEAGHGRSNNLWTTSHKFLFINGFSCCDNYVGVVRQ
jgi:hypothetical protein